MPIDPSSSFQMSADPNKPVVRQMQDMIFGGLFGPDWRTNGQQATQSAGAQNVTNAILGGSWSPQRGMGSMMGSSPSSAARGTWNPAAQGAQQSGFRANPNYLDDNRTHGGMGGGSHL
ncbi:hypothetical protein AB4037_08555 [Labrys sp. KB_33_2]|uniref:hypothetical protein n=1 Tax=Labrys sp. KB_33_2 TaxID=3237479 RepID=UPI003F90A6B7